jgi:hypothetical protein
MKCKACGSDPILFQAFAWKPKNEPVTSQTKSSQATHSMVMYGQQQQLCNTHLQGNITLPSLHDHAKYNYSKDSNLLGCDTVLLGVRFTMFQRLVPSF